MNDKHPPGPRDEAWIDFKQDWLEGWEEYILETGDERHWMALGDGGTLFWEKLRLDLSRKKPRHPKTEAIRRALASGRPVPKWAADYIAGRLAGTVKLPRGLPTWSNAGLWWSETPQTPAAKRGERRNLRNKVLAWKKKFESPDYAREYQRKNGRKPPPGGAYRKALEQVAKETGMAAETLDKLVYPRQNGRR